MGQARWFRGIGERSVQPDSGRQNGPYRPRGCALDVRMMGCRCQNVRRGEWWACAPEQT